MCICNGWMGGHNEFFSRFILLHLRGRYFETEKIDHGSFLPRASHAKLLSGLLCA